MLGLLLVQEAVRNEADKALTATKKLFLYLPYIHNQSLTIQECTASLYQAKELESNLNFEIKHRVIIEQFGCHLHRNDILGRTSTPDEVAFLKQPHSDF